MTSQSNAPDLAHAPAMASPVGFDHISSGIRFEPEYNPFSTLFVDITHRCNMECNNCYIPNRSVPDLDTAWLYQVLGRLPKRTRIRLVGAEPTVRQDLPEIITQVRKIGHLPVILSNGLKMARPGYVAKLRKAGLRTVYLSMNGGLDDRQYEEIDGLRCADRKLQALDQLIENRMYITVGMILVRDCSENHLQEFIQYIEARPRVREVHLRSVGAMGRHMSDTQSFTLSELMEHTGRAISADISKKASLVIKRGTHAEFTHGQLKFQLTQWPDLNSMSRGRLTPDGFVEPCFENLIANSGGY
ncbi:radical SAM protein [Pseudomonadota bacterium]